MRYLTSQQLVTLANPYQQLILDEETFAANQPVLDQLSTTQKTELILRILAECPATELHQLTNQLALREVTPASTTAFQSLLHDAATVAKSIHTMSNDSNPHPYAELTHKNFDPSTFHNVARISKQLADEQQINLASNLALKTPIDKTNLLMKNIRNTFSGSEFLQTMSQALLINKLLRDLTGDKPEQVFTSRDFNVDLFNQFPKLVNYQLQDSKQISAVAEKLVNNTDPQSYSLISKNLARLNAAAHHQNHPFKQMQAAFNRCAEVKCEEALHLAQHHADAAVNQAADKSPSLATHPNRLFTPSTLSEQVRHNKQDLQTEEPHDQSYSDQGLSF